jgi:ectoine hydroxylase-related dioxygenase (phytanoyl-CoA dioxygenase family)
VNDSAAGGYDRPKGKSSCHVDDYVDSRGRIDCVAYIDDVAPGAGSFTVWPGSHHKCYRYLTTSKDGAANGYAPDAEKKNRTGGPDARPTWALGMQEAWEWCEANIVPVDCYGDAGTVVFYHNKLGHMAGANYGTSIRQATLTGFGLSEEALPVAELMEHAHDADIWRDWSEVVRRTGDDFGAPGARAVARVPDAGPMWYSRL